MYALAPDAFEALEVLNRGDYRPDLLVLDVSLPGMDGVQLLGKIRQHPQLATLPAIAMTSHAMKGDQERFLAAGFNGYISKPILDDAALVGPIEKLLGSHG
ncbi:MAG: response regulator [Gammaproteobacteria bacterium]